MKNENFIVIIQNLKIKVIRIRKSIASLQIFKVGIKTGKFQKLKAFRFQKNPFYQVSPSLAEMLEILGLN